MDKPDRREQVIQEYRRWLDQFGWDLYCTLKITSGRPSDRRAKQMFERWITNVERMEGGNRFRWARVMEKGLTGNNRHFHVLIGGLRNRTRFWERRWNNLGGSALITPFDANQQGILYMLKSADQNGDIDIDFKLPAGRGKERLLTKNIK
jgi:hypothetical protein